MGARQREVEPLSPWACVAWARGDDGPRLVALPAVRRSALWPAPLAVERSARNVALTVLPTVRFFHLIAAAVWTGGILTLAALIPVLRKQGADRPMLQAAARQFARVSWVAMAVAIGTGAAQVVLMHLSWTYRPLLIKIGVVTLTVLVTGLHHVTAKNTSAAMRGALQGVLMLLSLGIFAAAVSLGS